MSSTPPAARKTRQVKPLYGNSLRFTNPLPRDIDKLMARIKGNKAALIIVDGNVGEGKTTLGVHLADYAAGHQIDFDKQLGLGGEDFMEKIAVCYDQKLVVVVYDEAGDFAGRAALTKFNQRLNRVFELFRAFKILVILILPDFAVLDKSMFSKGIPRFLVHCYGRGENYGCYKVYSLPRMRWLLHWRKKLVVPEMAFKYQSGNYYGFFKNLAPGRAKQLDIYSTEGKLDIITRGKPQGTVTKQFIADTLKRSTQWVAKKCKELGIEPQKKVGKYNYYEPEALKQLEAAL